MKILFAIKALHNVSGGAERVLANISGALADKGHNITVLSFDSPKGEPFYPLSPKINRVCMDIGEPLEKATIAESWHRLRALRKEIKAQDPDIVIPFMHSIFVIIAFACIGLKIPILASEHIVPQHYKGRKLEFFLLLVSSFFIKKMTVLSDQVKALYPKFMHKKMVPIANPVVSSKKLANPKGKKGEAKIILNVGRLVDQKDQQTLIKAFALITKEYPEWVLRIIGHGELKPDLQALIRSLELKDKVVLAGTTPNISKEYEKAQMLALSSRYESFGLVTAEAMAHGLPCIGFKDCPGTNELIIHGENGLLAEGPDRIEAMADAIEDLIKNTEKRIAFGKNAQTTIKPYSLDHIAELWESCIKETIA